jgi:glycosyltransferase involved in cell wall biosynthesis
MTVPVSVVVPFFNELENVEPLVRRMAEVFADLPGYDCEMILVDDGSSDGTGQWIEHLAASDSSLRPLLFDRNYGQSAALVAGMRLARGRLILTLDGDLQNDPADFPALLEKLKDYDAVFGYRTGRKDSWLRLASSRVANRVRSLLLRDGVRDTGCGLKGFRREVVPHLVSFNGAHRFFAVTVHLAGLNLAEHPVRHHPRQNGTSSYGVHNRLWRSLLDLIGVRWLCLRYVNPTTRGNEE